MKEVPPTSESQHALSATEDNLLANARGEAFDTSGVLEHPRSRRIAASRSTRITCTALPHPNIPRVRLSVHPDLPWVENERAGMEVNSARHRLVGSECEDDAGEYNGEAIE